MKINNKLLKLDFTSFKTRLEIEANEQFSNQVLSENIGIGRATLWRLLHTKKSVSFESVKLISLFIGEDFNKYLL